MVSDRVNIVVPIYKDTFDIYEKTSLQRCFSILGDNYEITAIVPKSMSTDKLLTEYPKFKIERFDDCNFRSIVDYNKFLLSEDIYKRFEKWEYILIYQTDAYVFEDNLEYWCSKGYDYIGAPWIKKDIHNFLPYKIFEIAVSRLKKGGHSYNIRYNFRNKIGNGGLSLRKVSSHIQFIKDNPQLCDMYKERCNHHIFNEDVFWAIEPLKKFKYPSVDEALNFSFDIYPDHCIKRNKGKLPFGCHGFNKRKMRNFWSKYINLSEC